MKKRIMRLLTCTMALCLVSAGLVFVSAADPGCRAYAAGKAVKLSKTKVTVNPGDKITIKVKNADKKVKWSTSSKSKVKITKKKGKYCQTAVLKAGTKTGKCTIKAKVGKKTLKCVVTVKNPALSKKALSLVAGDMTTLSVKNAKSKVKWTTSDKNNVRICRTSGKFGQSVFLEAGDQTGKCTVKAKIGKKVLKCTVTVKLPDPGIQDIPAEKITDFSVKLLQGTLAGGEPAEKVLVSPDSVVTALALVENGAEGETLGELEGLCDGLTIDDLNAYLKDLHTRLQKPDRPIYTTANSIWYREGSVVMAEDFVNRCQTYHDAVVKGAAFDDSTVSEINNWVKANTRGMIQDIIDRLDPSARVVLVNALAFEGDWAEKFGDPDPSGKFTDYKGAAKKVKMLNGMLTGEGAYIELKGGKGLVKCYETGNTAFVGILPPEGTDIDAYINSLTGEDLVKAWKSRKNYDVRIQIPEFTYDYGTSLKDVLAAMGAARMFDPSAEFCRMTGTEDNQVYVDDVLHKTHIEVDKDGTKAAAATAVIGKASSALLPSTIKEVYLDRPFVYAIVDMETGIPLFIGAVKTL